MKRTRRVSVEIEHRTLIVSVAGGESKWETSFHAEGGAGHPGCGNGAAVPPVCPNCGAPWIAAASITSLQEIVAGSDVICRALQQRGLHAFVSANEVRICSKSFEGVRASL